MATRRTGKDGAATAGSTTFILRNWRYRERGLSLDHGAAGDLWVQRSHLRKDYQAQIQGFQPRAEPYLTVATGEDIAFVLKAQAADGGQFIADTGYGEEAEIEWPFDGAATLNATIISQDGAAGPVVDLSPTT